MTEVLTVGQAAAASGLTTKAVRLYERRGLLPPIERSHAGYRQFRKEDIDRLTFIRRARSLGLHLDDIATILAAAVGKHRPCGTVRSLLDQRIGEIDRTIEELTSLRATLIAVRDSQPRDTAGICPVIDSATR